MNYASHKLIASLISRLDHEHSLVIVDNFSSEDELASLRQVLPAGAKLLAQPNAGFAAGVNAAWSAAPHDSPLLILNPDAWFTPGSLGRLIDAASEHHLDIASPRILQSRNGPIWFDGGRIDQRTGEVIHDGYGSHPINIGHEPKRTEFVSGCALYLSPRAQELLLPMNESLFMYYEDAELSSRAARIGLPAWVVPDAVAIHDEGATSRSSTDTRSPLFYYFQARNRLYADLNATLVSRKLSTPLVLARSIARVLRHERAAKHALMIRAVLRGTAHGLRRSERGV
ncbi:GT2 family glycosyltransferase [Microbacterium trichothecenolyticum]|uniref:glycosyltransferase family 2 protein n=1 Tax=Microbacterium trichothecenolyticum TaxID=69370 RepID=UPI00285BF6D7|nr:glycosyltransferase family 2 protein [Microbacterium trichothecenolyticum]MDR7184914.1 GT2 family glycosyltransferase [Microbacterium trichothecenolyticum]